MVKSLLPPLNDDHAVAIPSTHGKWTIDENSILGRIANGLKDITIEQEVEDLISIPDVWARVAVVKNALFDDKHPLNYTVRGEWRGLLALFALMPYHGKNIETGRPCSAGVYFWVIEYKDIYGKIERMNGFVQLVN